MAANLLLAAYASGRAAGGIRKRQGLEGIKANGQCRISTGWEVQESQEVS